MAKNLDSLVEQSVGIVFPFSESWESAHTSFATKMWPQKNRRRDPAFNRWKFRGLETGPVDGLLLAVLDGQVVGQLGLIPVTLTVNGQEFAAQWACDLMVDHSLRRKGIGSLLLAAGMKRSMITLGSNPSASADATMSQLGFKPLLGPRSMFLPIEPSQAISLRLPTRYQRLTPILSKFASPLITLRTYRLRANTRHEAARLVPWSDVAGLVQKLDIRVPHIAHDLAFLEWRCKGKAGFSPELNAFLTSTGAFAIFQPSHSIFYVYDWHADTLMETQALFRGIYRLASEHKSQTITVLANSPQEQVWLNQLGFLASRTPVKVIYYPDVPLNHFDRFHYCHYDSDGNL